MKNPLLPLVFYGMILPWLFQALTHHFLLSCVLAWLVGAITQLEARNARDARTFLCMLVGVLITLFVTNNLLMPHDMLFAPR